MAHYKSNMQTKETPTSNNSNAEYTLYVNDLPVELNEHGLLQIFNHYGNIIGHFYRPNTSWAYITYGSCIESDAAIRDLHNVPPLRLKVSYAKPKTGNEVQLSKASSNNVEQYENPIQTNVEPGPFIQTRGRGKPLDIFKQVEPNPGCPHYPYTSNDDLLYPVPSDPDTFNPYENAGPYPNTNTLWTRGQLTITQDGKRHVCLGRGYTMYDIPNPYPEVQNHISKVYEKRISGLYEYGNDMLQNDIGKCQKCAKLTRFSCERCLSFYCSRYCQMLDWPQHKVNCQSLPALITPMNSMHLSQPNELNNGEQSPTKSSTMQLPLRRPKKLVEQETSPNQRTNMITKQIKHITEVPVTVHSDSSKNNELKSSDSKTTDPCNGYQNVEVKAKVSTPTQDKSNFQTNRTDVNDKPEVKDEHLIQLKSIEKQSNITSKQQFDTQSNHTQNSRSDKMADDKKSESVVNIIKRRPNFNVNDVKKIEEGIAFTKQTFLSKTKFTDVRIIVPENREHWIQKVEDSESIVKLMTELQGDANKAEKVKAIVGNIYAVEYESVWHRGLITCLNPMTVHYIDYGNDEVIQSDDFREIDKYKNIPSYCAKIRLSEKAYKKYKNLKYEDIISVKMLSADSNKVINVEVQGENDVPPSQVAQANDTPVPNTPKMSHTPVPSTPKRPDTDNIAASPKIPSNNELCSVSNLKSVVSTVSIGEGGLLEIHAELNNNTYSVTLLPNSAISDFEKLLNALPEECEGNTKKYPNHRPRVRDVICGQRLDGDWLRGYVLSLESPLKMAIVDEARMMPVTKTVPCSEEFLNISAFGSTCEIINAKHKFNTSDQYEFKVITRKGQNEIEIEILKDDDKLKAVVKPWVPVPEQEGLQYTKLKSGSEVCITAYRSHIHLFVRSLKNEDVEHFNQVMQKVAKCAQTAPFLKEPPVVGQMVIAQYVDDNYYRAIVTKVQADKITISYVDFGNTEVANIKKLQTLSDDLKQLQSCTSKILLKDVPQDVPMTKEVSDYFVGLVGREIPLICTFDGIPSKDGAYLKLHTGECINKTIKEMLVPAWNKTGEEDKTCYMVNDLNVASLGKSGDVVEVLVLHSIVDGYRYAMCPLDYDLMTHVFDIMPKAMTEYCERTEHYIPRDKELCLALYEKGWYRAACMNRSETPTTSTVFFIDFGNVESVSHKDIRVMPKDFITPNALASVCTIVNVAPVDSSGQYTPEIEKKVTELVIPNNCIKVKITECVEESGMYDVELPMVRSKLIEEGLVPS